MKYEYSADTNTRTARQDPKLGSKSVDKVTAQQDFRDKQQAAKGKSRKARAYLTDSDPLS
jgi:hypothetical protein